MHPEVGCPSGFNGPPLIIVGRHALTTLRIGADTFNIIAVQMKHGWSAPFVLGIGYPFRDALMERGVSPTDAERFYAALVALEAVQPGSYVALALRRRAYFNERGRSARALAETQRFTPDFPHDFNCP